MVLAALFGSLVGLALGLTGAGRSILAVPLLVYGLGFEFRQAVALSLAIVGLTALYGAFLQRSHGQSSCEKSLRQPIVLQCESCKEKQRTISI